MSNYTVTNNLDAAITLPGLSHLQPGNNTTEPTDWQTARTSPVVRQAMVNGAITVKDPSGTTITASSSSVTALKSGNPSNVYASYTLSDGGDVVS